MPEHLDRTNGGGNVTVRHYIAAAAALLSVGTPARASDHAGGNAFGHGGTAEIGIASPAAPYDDPGYTFDDTIGHDRSVATLAADESRYDDPGYAFDDSNGDDRAVPLALVNGVPYDDPGYTFDDAIGSTTARSSDGARDVATEASRRAAR